MSSASEPALPDPESRLTQGEDGLKDLLLRPEPPLVVSGQARLEALIGRKLARFLIASLSPGQGRRG